MPQVHGTACLTFQRIFLFRKSFHCKQQFNNAVMVPPCSFGNVVRFVVSIIQFLLISQLLQVSQTVNRA
jgi:hypothetical protein